jgi:hypothetical protein
MGSGPTSNEHRFYVKYVTARYISLVATRKPCLVQALSRSLIHVLVVLRVSPQAQSCATHEGRAIFNSYPSLILQRSGMLFY